MLKLKNKYIQILSLLSIVILLISALFVDFKRDFLNFLHTRFLYENAVKNCNAMSGTIFEIINGQLELISSNTKTQNVQYAETLISKNNGTYYNNTYCFVKNRDSIYCVSIFKLIGEKMKISQQLFSYLLYLVLIILTLLILLRFIDSKQIDIETFIIVLLEQIFNYSFFIANIGFNANFNNCYTSFLFYFYLCFLLLQFFATKKHKFYFIYFAIIWLSIAVFISQDILLIYRSHFKFTFYRFELITIIGITIRHGIKIFRETHNIYTKG